MLYIRPQAATLAARLDEPRRFIQVLAGPRQVGKTTLVRQVIAGLRTPSGYVNADEPGLRDPQWLAHQWAEARQQASGRSGGVLVIDEAQKIPGWSETVKRLWDEDTWEGRRLKVVLLGSAPLLVQQGLSESLAGRFEVIRVPHWSFAEMQEAFGWSLDRYLFYGGYPGAVPLVSDAARWRQYILDAIVETTVSRDVLLMSRVDKPALLRRTFELGCRYSGQILSYTKMLGQLLDAGNTTTIAHYLDLLGGAGLVTGLQKYAGQAVRQRGSIPKLQVYNNALLAAASGVAMKDARADGAVWGRFVESAVGAHLANAAAARECEVFYWRERDAEVDFVVKAGPRLAALEVKSGRPRDTASGAAAFARVAGPHRFFVVGEGGIPVADFLRQPVSAWLETVLPAVREAFEPWGRPRRRRRPVRH
jgi:hypothetical protein